MTMRQIHEQITATKVAKNAPEDSAYISDEQNCQEKIINESSLMDDDQLMMTGRSESIIDADEDVESTSQCKSIN